MTTNIRALHFEGYNAGVDNGAAVYVAPNANTHFIRWSGGVIRNCKFDTSYGGVKNWSLFRLDRGVDLEIENISTATGTNVTGTQATLRHVVTTTGVTRPMTVGKRAVNLYSPAYTWSPDTLTVGSGGSVAVIDRNIAPSISNAPLPAPTGLTSTITTDNNVALTWTAVTGASSYFVYRRNVTTGEHYRFYAAVPGASFVDYGAGSGSTLWAYTVSAIPIPIGTQAAGVTYQGVADNGTVITQYQAYGDITTPTRLEAVGPSDWSVTNPTGAGAIAVAPNTLAPGIWVTPGNAWQFITGATAGGQTTVDRPLGVAFGISGDSIGWQFDADVRMDPTYPARLLVSLGYNGPGPGSWNMQWKIDNNVVDMTYFTTASGNVNAIAATTFSGALGNYWTTVSVGLVPQTDGTGLASFSTSGIVRASFTVPSTVMNAFKPGMFAIGATEIYSATQNYIATVRGPGGDTNGPKITQFL